MRIRSIPVAVGTLLALVIPGTAAASTPGWEAVTPPALSTGGDQQLTAVTSADLHVWAVGTQRLTSPARKLPFAEHWDGTRWSVMQMPSLGAFSHITLSDVVAIAADDVWAVGDAYDPSWIETKTYVSHWDGSEWRIIPSPNPNDLDTGVNKLSGIAASGPNDVWAVGHHWDAASSPKPQAMVQRWDGQRWSLVQLPDLGPNSSELQGVAVRAANDVWAVGYTASRDPRWEIEPLVLHWDGMSWTRVDTPNAGGRGTHLHRVTVTRDGIPFAVGVQETYNWDGGTIPSAAIMRADGGTWAFEHVPGYEYHLSSSNDVEVAPNGDVWMLGGARSTSGSYQYARFDGTNWENIEGALPNFWSVSRFDLTVTDNNQVWTVGGYQDDPQSPDFPYAEHSPIP